MKKSLISLFLPLFFAGSLLQTAFVETSFSDDLFVADEFAHHTLRKRSNKKTILPRHGSDLPVPPRRTQPSQPLFFRDMSAAIIQPESTLELYGASTLPFVKPARSFFLPIRAGPC